MCPFHIRFRHKRCEPAAVANTQDVGAVAVDKIIIIQCAKSGPIASELRCEIVLCANTFAVADALFIDAEETEARKLSEAAKHQTSCIFRVRRRFYRITTQPAGNENDRQFPCRIMWLGNDRS